MAVSGDFATSNSYILYNIHVDEAGQSVAGNYTTVRVYVQAWRTNNYSTNQDGRCDVTIDGTSYTTTWVYPEKPISQWSYTTLFDTTVDIPHNADGSKTLHVEAKIQQPSYSSNYNGFDVVLTSIPRQATITSTENFYDDQNPTVKYSNPAGNAATQLRMYISLDGGSTATIGFRDVSKTGSSYTFNFTDAERNALRSAIPNATQTQATFVIVTVIGGVTYYSTKNSWLVIRPGAPVIGGKSYRDSNSTTTAITGNDQYIIQNKSNLYFSFTGVAAQKYATISSMTVNINGTVKNVSISGTNGTCNFGTINVNSNVTATVTLTDSRGFVTSTTMTISVYAYANPSVAVSAKRKNNYYEETTIKAGTPTYSELGGNNSISIVWKYKVSTASSWTNGGTWYGANSTTRNFDINKSYNVNFVLYDRLSSVSYDVFVDYGTPILFIDYKLRRVGVNIFPTVDFQVAGDAKANSWTQNSSRKIKKNIELMDLEEAEKILLLQAVSFDYKEERFGGDKRGFIAEDVAEVLPNLVTPEEGDSPAGLDYISMIPYLQTIIKDQEERIRALEERLGGISDGTDQS